MRPFAILRPGRFRDAGGQVVNLSAWHLWHLAEHYRPTEGQAPIVLGHPGGREEPLGWILALRYRPDHHGGILYAYPEEVAPELKEAVAAGRYRRVSAKLNRNGAVALSEPDAWSLAHVGMLGAASPAVPGLPPVEVLDDDLAEFADAPLVKRPYFLSEGERQTLLRAAAVRQIRPEWSDAVSLAAVMEPTPVLAPVSHAQEAAHAFAGAQMDPGVVTVVFEAPAGNGRGSVLWGVAPHRHRTPIRPPATQR